MQPQPYTADVIARYLSGQLRQAVLQPGFIPSRVEDVPHIDQLPRTQRDAWLDAGLGCVRQGQVAFGILAAGAASRMDVHQLPFTAQQLLKKAGRETLPQSKALVPVWEFQGRVWTYLDLFVANVSRLSQQAAAHGPVVLFVSESNQAEYPPHLASLAESGYEVRNIVLLIQPLVPAFVATASDAARASSHFPQDELESVLGYCHAHAGELLPQKKPAGHGEFLHQLIESGLLWQLWKQGVRYLSVRNIDNVAALLDWRWLTALGYLHQQQADMLVEVSQRPVGQKGGALIRREKKWQIAEDPSFIGTNYSAKDSYYINNAVAIINLELLWKLYDTSPAAIDRLNESDSQQRALWLQQIADRGRSKFPTLIDPKPFRLPNGQLVAAVVPETNLWESTGCDARITMVPLAVDSDQDAGADLLSQPTHVREARALRVRFCPTKTWSDYQEPRKQYITHRLARRILSERLIDPTA